MGFKKRILSKQDFGSAYTQGGFVPQSPERNNLGRTSGLSYKRYPFQVDIVGDVPVISGDRDFILNVTQSFRCDFKINKGYVIDAVVLGLTPGSLSLVELRENKDIVIVQNGSRTILEEEEYLDDAIEARISGAEMVETKTETGPTVGLFFDFANGSLANFNNGINNPVLYFEIKHENTLDVLTSSFAKIFSVNIYSIEQLCEKYGLLAWVPGAGLDTDAELFSTTYYRLFSAEFYGFQFALGKSYIEFKSNLGQPMPPGWDSDLPTQEFAYFNPQNPFNLLYNPIIGVRGAKTP